MKISYVKKGVCAPTGFSASGIHAGFRKNPGKKDLALIYCKKECDVAAVYTKNKVKGAPIHVTKEHIADGKAQAIIVNSGNANTCAPNGTEIAKEACSLLAAELDIKVKDIIICSTGVIGEKLDIQPFKSGIPKLTKKMSLDGSGSAAKAIMTTDKVPKEVAVSFPLKDKIIKIGGIAKGSGMINPNMATMLSFITTDADISSEMLSVALHEDIKDSFNQLTVDGDTSTNDTVAVMASGLAGNNRITEKNDDFFKFSKALKEVTTWLCRELAKDAEGAGKFLETIVVGAENKDAARKVSKTITDSALVKTAIFGEDANWGRILCAAGYADCDCSVSNVDVIISSAQGNIQVCRHTMAIDFSEEKAKKILEEDEIKLIVDLNSGNEQSQAYGCDLTYNYVKINGKYRT